MSQRMPLPMETSHLPPAPPAAFPAPTPAEATAVAEPLTPEQTEQLRRGIIDTLHTIFDPEVPVNIYELGLVYGIDIHPSAAVDIRMTLTTPACPVAGSLPPEVEKKVRGIAGIRSVKVEVVWDPPWDKDRMSEAAKLQLGIDD